MKYYIKRAETSEDAKAIRKIARNTWLDTYCNNEITPEIINSHFDEKETPEKLQNFENNLNSEKRINWIAYSGKTPIAWNGASVDDEGIGGFAIYVLPEYQGLGIGKEMLTKTMNWLREHCSTVRIGVLEGNSKALNIYKNIGFKETGNREDFKLKDFPGKDMIIQMEFKFEK